MGKTPHSSQWSYPSAKTNVDLVAAKSPWFYTNESSPFRSSMASAATLCVLLSFLPFVTPIQRREAQKSIALDSFLKPTTDPSAWFSPSGRVAFGFYPEVGGGFYVGAWLITSPGNFTVLWTWKRDEAPLEGDSSGLKLIARGLALVQNASDAEDDYIFHASHAFAHSASMLDAGNFVIYDDGSNVIWNSAQSINPTDTIISGQVLDSNFELVSSVSSTNHSIGRFRLKMQRDGNLAMFPVNTSDASENCYWSSNTSLNCQSSNCTGLGLSADGRLYLQRQLQIDTIKPRPDINLTSSNQKRGSFYRATMDSDGYFKLYLHNLYSNSTIILDTFPDESTEPCEIKGTCGINSYCTVQNELPVCECLPGFEFIDPELEWSGCKRNFTSETCSSEDGGFAYNMSQLEKVQWLDDAYEGPWHVDFMEDCREACLKDCNCFAALYANSTCSKQKSPLKYGRRLLDQSASVLTFVKVGVSKFNGTSSIESHKHCCTIMFDASAATNGALCVLVFVLCFSIYRHRSRGYRIMSRNRELDSVEEIAPRSFSFQELRIASDDFRQVIGKGAFGTVFKGVLPFNRREIAIKRLEKLTGEGEKEFRAEMRTMGKTHHRNLVHLLGFCHEGSHRLLVYEFIRNGSLADLIFHAADHRLPEWSERVKIAIDVARGIRYLHEECENSIIHCDIKPENILIDEAGTAKISDFGFAKLLTPRQSKALTEARGTRGYLAPEWHRNAPITVKVDVYSFGVVLLEVVCCRRSMEGAAEVEEILLLDWVQDCFLRGEVGKLVPDHEVDAGELNRLVKVGLWCTQPEPGFRPSMKKVMLMLEGHIHISVPPPLPCSYSISMNWTRSSLN